MADYIGPFVHYFEEELWLKTGSLKAEVASGSILTQNVVFAPAFGVSDSASSEFVFNFTPLNPLENNRVFFLEKRR